MYYCRKGGNVLITCLNTLFLKTLRSIKICYRQLMTIYSILITVQRGATQSSPFIILQVHSTCFGRQPHPSSGVHKTVTTASGTGHIFCTATSLQRSQTSLATLEGGGCTVLEGVVTVLCIRDDGCA